MDDNAKTILRQILAELQGTLTVSAPAGGATEAKQDTIIGHIDGIETLIGTTNSTLTTIDGHVDGIEALLGGTLTVDSELPAAAALSDITANPTAPMVGAALMGWDSSNWSRAWQYSPGDTDNNDKALITAGRLQGWTGAAWARIPGSATDGLTVNLGANNDITGTVDLGATDNAVLDAIAASVAAIDTDTSTIIGHVDGIETLITSSNTKLDSVISGVDGLEALIGTTNTSLTTIDGRVDGLETSNSAIQTATELIDDTVVVLGTATYTEATSKGLGIGAVRRDADTTLVNTTNEWGPLQMDANGRLKVEVFSGETLPVSLTSTTITGQVTVGDGTDAVDVLAAGADGVANTNNQLVAASLGYVYDTAAGDYNRAIQSVQSLNITGDGLQAVGLAAKFDDTSPTTITENQFGHLRMSASGVLYVGGVAAHDGVDATNPLTQGYRAIAHGTNPTAVAAADVTVGYANRAGVPFVIGGHPNVITREVTVLDSDGAQTNASLVGTIASGAKVVVTQIIVVADNANTSDVAVRIGFGTASVPAAALAGVNGLLFSHPGIPSGLGAGRGDGSGIIGVGADGEELRMTCEDPVNGSITVTISYYTIES